VTPTRPDELTPLVGQAGPMVGPKFGGSCRASAEITAMPSTVIPAPRCQQQRALSQWALIR
jgi:hypothetical protein